MEKKLITQLKTNVYRVSGKKEEREYNFISYEITLPDNTTIQMVASKKNYQQPLAHLVIYEENLLKK